MGKGSRRIGSIGMALAAAAAATGTMTVPQINAPQATVQAVKDGSRAPVSAPVAGAVSQNVIARMVEGGFPMMSYGKPPVWIGLDKRGNRRNRSRFSYGR